MASTYMIPLVSHVISLRRLPVDILLTILYFPTPTAGCLFQGGGAIAATGGTVTVRASEFTKNKSDVGI